MRKRKPQNCAVCGDVITDIPINARIEGKEYVFDREECMLLLQKLLKVYGNNFKFILNPSRTAL
jgi:hypothetical protein